MAEIKRNPKYIPDYSKVPGWEKYQCNLDTEWLQCTDEGKDIEKYKSLFDAIIALPEGAHKDALADTLFEIIEETPVKADYPYVEPSDLPGIRAERKAFSYSRREVGKEELYDKILGAWKGRICGCLLGKPIEGIRTHELIPFLKETGNYPMYRYIKNSEVTDEIAGKYGYPLKNRCYPDNIECSPADDDTNYPTLYQIIVDKYGRDFTPADVAFAWMDYQPKYAYCTAERVAFVNFTDGIMPPYSASYKNPYREWIGAQIRGDYFGYINPGNTQLAAEMAWRDASVSHVKNGIYGEMFAAAMLAAAAVCDNVEEVIRAGLAEIPAKSRLYAQVEEILACKAAGGSFEDATSCMKKYYSEYTEYGWCHTNSNAMIVAACLLWGEGDYGKSICMAVQTGYDTDCNGATVGSIIGMMKGSAAVGEEWYSATRGMLDTAIFGVGRVKIEDLAKKTMEHIR